MKNTMRVMLAASMVLAFTACKKEEAAPVAEAQQALVAPAKDDDAGWKKYLQAVAVQNENVLREKEVAENNRKRAVVIEQERVTRAKDLEVVAREKEVTLQRIDADKAVEVQKKAVELAPDAPAYKLGLARLLLQSGDKVGARAELSALTALGAKFPRQSEVAALIKQVDQ